MKNNIVFYAFLAVLMHAVGLFFIFNVFEFDSEKKEPPKKIMHAKVLDVTKVPGTKAYKEIEQRKQQKINAEKERQRKIAEEKKRQAEIKKQKELAEKKRLLEEAKKRDAELALKRKQEEEEKKRLEEEKRLAEISEPITVAVMGCVVNGPGEAREADVGIAGGINEGLIFRKGEVLKKVAEADIIDELFAEIDKILLERKVSNK